MRAALNAAIVALVLAPATAAAQPPPTLDGVNFERLMGKKIRIVDSRGVERFGKLRGADGGELRLLVPTGEVTVPFAEVRRLDRRDSVIEGFIIGLLWPPIAIPLGAGQGFDSERQMWKALPGGMLVCGAIGAGIDALNKGWTNVYRSDRSGRSAFGIAPSRGGVRVTYIRRF
jgi:hypothetical protein